MNALTSLWMFLAISGLGLSAERYPIEQTSDPRIMLSVVAVRSHEPPFTGEAPLRVFLRLANRGSEEIFVEAFDLSSRRNDSALLHDVFEDGVCPHSLTPASAKSASEPLIGYSRLHTYSVVPIAPAGSMQFSVPVDHLQRGRCVRIRYWIGGGGSPPSNASEYRYSYVKAAGHWLRNGGRVGK